MDNTKKEINVKLIMAEIRQEIKEKGYKNEDLPFSDIRILPSIGNMIHSGSLNGNIRALNLDHNVPVYRPLKSNRFFGPLIIFVKKIIRKSVKFYIEPVIADQNELNRVTAICLQDLYIELKVMQQKVKMLEYENIQLTEKQENS